MEPFKIIFLSGYQVKNISDDNLDIHLALENGNVFFATIFTIDNIKSLMLKDNTDYFWASDMVIVKDLRKETIWLAMAEIIRDEYLEGSFSKIGTVKEIYSGKNYDELEDMINISR